MTAVRKATRFDIPEIEACAVAAYTRYVKRIGREPAPMVADFAASIDKGHLYVAQEDGQVVGFVVFYPEQDITMGGVQLIGVCSNYRTE